MQGSAFGFIATCAITLALAACSKPATRPVAPVPATIPSTPSPPARAPVVKPKAAPIVAPTKGPIVLGSRGFGERKNRIKAALAKNAADALPAEDVGYYIDVLQGRLKQVASTQVGVVVGRQGNDLILDLSARLDFDAGSAVTTPAIREMLSPIAKVLVEYRMMLVVVNASPDDLADGEPDIRLVEQRALAIARHLADAGVAPSRIVVAGSSATRLSDSHTLPQTRTHLEIHLEPIIRVADAAHSEPPYKG